MPGRGDTARRYEGRGGVHPLGSSIGVCTHAPPPQRSSVHGSPSSVHKVWSSIPPVATHPWASAPTPGWHTASEHSFGATHTSLSGWCTQAPPSQKSSVHPSPSSQVIDWPKQVPSVHRSPTV